MPRTPLTIKCRYCKKSYTILVDIIGYNQWINGVLIQKALPESSRADRELLQSNTCNQCWNTLFDNPEDRDE